MNTINKYFQLALLFVVVALFFTSCSKDEITESIPTQEKAQKLQKDIEVMSENRKTVAIVTVYAENEAILATYDAESFNLRPVFELAEATEGDTQGGSIANIQEGMPTIDFEVNIVKQEAGALGVQFAEIKDDSRANWLHVRTYVTNYRCVRVYTEAGHVKTNFYNRDCPSCPWEHKDTDWDYAGEKATYCHLIKVKKVEIFFDMNYSNNEAKIVFWNYI